MLEAGEDLVLIALEAHGMKAPRGLGGIRAVKFQILHRAAGTEHELIGSLEGDGMGGRRGGKKEAD